MVTISSFSDDVWVGEQPLRTLFPSLFKLSKKKNVVLREMISSEGAWDFNFLRSLNMQEMLEIVNLLQVIGEPAVLLNNLDGAEDNRHWTFGRGEGFSVANAYSAMDLGGFLSFPYKQLWNPKIPLTVAFLVWTLCYNRAATLDKLHSAGLVQDSTCLFCGLHVETNSDLFLHCQTKNGIWDYFLKSFGVSWVHSLDVKRTIWEWGKRKSKKMVKKLWSYLPFAIWWCLRNERNNRLYKNLARNTKQLITEVKCLLLNWTINTDIFRGFSLSTLICNWDVVMHASM
ncbi:uncharacterized protein LOC113279100 [Papaver somniferum]|uniref:uncharacterized protein LOC113279100 n=1 Tax=Papaver somniferum TaxID=3469 RepID=UPI000E703594|nr:uncharacterized protein LOC113279100 [Papaver somniferum]